MRADVRHTVQIQVFNLVYTPSIRLGPTYVRARTKYVQRHVDPRQPGGSATLLDGRARAAAVDTRDETGAARVLRAGSGGPAGAPLAGHGHEAIRSPRPTAYGYRIAGDCSR